MKLKRSRSLKLRLIIKQTLKEVSFRADIKRRLKERH